MNSTHRFHRPRDTSRRQLRRKPYRLLVVAVTRHGVLRQDRCPSQGRRGNRRSVALRQGMEGSAARVGSECKRNANAGKGPF